MTKYRVIGEGSPMCNPFGYYKRDLRVGEYAVVDGDATECANGGHAYSPLYVFSRFDDATNFRRATNYADARNAGKSDADSKAIIAGEVVVVLPYELTT